MKIKISSRVYINILFLPIVAASILGGYFTELSVAYACALLHELSHIFAAGRLGIGIAYIEFQPFGICARLKSEVIKNPLCEIAVAAVGPITNLALCGAAVLLCKIQGTGVNIFSYFISCNLAMAAINLVPALPLDGGRILKAAISMRYGTLPAYNYTIKISKIPIFIILAASAVTLVMCRFNFSMILIGVFLLGNLLAEQQSISRHAIREMLDYENKIKNQDMKKAVTITSHISTPARKILSRLSYGGYHIIHVIDDDLRVVKTLTEGELVRALLKKGIRITLGEV